MQIDWFTLAAEIVNFLILLFLLKKFLYDRILTIADEREEEIGRRYEAAEEKAQSAAEKEERYRQKEQEITEKRDELLRAAKEKAVSRRRELLNEARDEVEARKSQWLDTLRQSQQDFLRRLSQETGAYIHAATRRVLRDLADAELEHKVVGVFTDKMTALPDAEQNDLAAALDDADEPRARVRSAFTLADADRERIEATFAETFSRSPDFVYEEEADLICGIELQVNGRQLSWNIDSYLDALSERTADTLQAQWQDFTPVAAAENGETAPDREAIDAN